MTSPDWMSAIRRAAALVTDGGGVTCHAAIISRELGVPCVVGTRQATRCCATGRSSPSTATPARCARARRDRSRPRRRTAGEAPPPRRPLRGRTAHPGLREPGRWPSTPRRSRRCRSTASGCCARSSWSTEALRGRAPAAAAGARRAGAVRRRGWPASLLTITSAFAPRPVVYRSIDFRTNEFRGLEGGDRVRAGRGEPDDRVPRLLPVRHASPTCSPSSSTCSARVRGADPEPAPDAAVRPLRVGARGVPGTGRAPPDRGGRCPVWVMAEVPRWRTGSRRTPGWASRACPSAATT